MFWWSALLFRIARENIVSQVTSYQYPAGSLHCCQYCDMVFETQISLSGHITQIHAQSHADLWPCRYCERIFSSIGGKQQHERLHTGRGFKCDNCSKVFTTAQILQRHKRAVHNKERFSCKHCAKSFTRADVLSLHQRNNCTLRK